MLTAFADFSYAQEKMDISFRSHRTPALLFLLSLSVRALLLVPVIKAGVPPKFDEVSYFRRAAAGSSMAAEMSHFRAPREKDRDAFYGNGIFPPFHPIWLSLGMLIFGKTVAVARIMGMLLSAATTPLVYLLTRRLGGPKAGIFAACLHLFYPSFLAFSHYLWSENTYIFLLFLAVYLALGIPENPDAGKRLRHSLLLGVILGAMALTRAAALPALVIIPAWIFFKTKSRSAKIISPVLILAAMFITLVPWELALYQREKRFVMISNYTYRNLYAGHNYPAEDEKYDSVDDLDQQRQKTLRDYARAKSIPVEAAARELAVKQIMAHPGEAFLKGIKEFLFLWTFDFFPLRHIVNLIYPPVSGAFVLPAFLVFALSAAFLYLLTLKGLLIKAPRLENRTLILLLILGGALPYVVAYGSTRYNLPQIALLLPIAGFGLANFKEKARAFFPLAAAVLVALGILFARSWPDYFYQRLRPSSFYAGPIGSLDRAFGIRSEFGDEFLLRNSEPGKPDTLTLTIVGEDAGYSFDSRSPVNTLVIRLSSNRDQGPFTVFGRDPRRPLELMIFSEGQNKTVAVKPLDAAFWRRPAGFGFTGIELTWRGGR